MANTVLTIGFRSRTGDERMIRDRPHSTSCRRFRPTKGAALASIRSAILAIAAFALSGREAASAAERLWTDASGKYTVSATLVSYDLTHVVLRNPSGKQITLERSKLSLGDRKYLESLERSAHDSAPPQDFPSLEDATERMTIASDALAACEAFVADNQVSKYDRSLAEDRLLHWKKLADENAVKYAGKWLSREEVDKLQGNAEELIADAYDYLDKADATLAAKRLREASIVDPEGVEADFTLGLLDSLVFRDWIKGRSRFRVCIKRLADRGDRLTALEHARMYGAMNNAAVCDMRLNEYGPALKKWRSVVESGLPCVETMQNLDVLSRLTADETFEGYSPSTQESAVTLTADLSSRFPWLGVHSHGGWSYVPYLESQPTSLRTDSPSETGEPSTSRRASREVSGHAPFAVLCAIAVRKDVLLTLGDSVISADQLSIPSRGRSLEEVTSVNAVSRPSDLAFIQASGANYKSVARFAASLPPADAEVRILRFRSTSSRQLGVSDARVSSSVPPPVEGYGPGDVFALAGLRQDCPCGGIVIDSHGFVIGLLLPWQMARRTTPIAVSGSAVREKALAALGDDGKMPAPGPPSPDSDWKDAISAAEQSISQLIALAAFAERPWEDENLCRRLYGAEVDFPAGWDGLHDSWCMACDGVGEVECRNRSCKNGVIVTMVDRIVHIPGGPSRIIKEVSRSECPDCDGTGWVRCQRCYGSGDDPDL